MYESAYLHTDTALKLELQPDHVHLVHLTELVEFRHFAAHLIDGHLDGVHLCALLLHHLDPFLQIRKHGARWSQKSSDQ